jgi:TIR domain-containing protein
MPDVFISYPRQATKDAATLAGALRDKGVTAWTASDSLATGDTDWKSEIYQALDSANAVVFLVLPQTTPSAWMQEEYMKALESYWSGKTRLLVPLLVGTAEPPSFLRDWQSVSIRKESDWTRAANQIKEWLHSPADHRNEPSKQSKQERDQRLSLITKALTTLRETAAEMNGPDESPEKRKSVVSSSPRGESTQVGKKKSRASKARK